MMLIGSMRVSKSDGSQSLDLQRDALVAAGVAPERLYEDHASGRQERGPGSRRASRHSNRAIRSWCGNSIGSDAR
jgi:DNA invertase Pin-like site-specific DNA recombinase